MTKNRLIITLGILFVLLFSTGATAGDKLIIKPVIDTAYMIDTNFYRSAANERTVSTLTVSPGMEFGYRTEKSKVSAKGFLNITRYDDLDSVPAGMTSSDDNDYIGHNLMLSADTVLFTRITAGLDDTWINTRNPSERDEFDNFIDINEYAINRVRPWVKYKISDRFSAGLELNNTSIDYAADIEEDSSQSGGKANLYYELSKFTTIDLEYSLWEMDYDLTSSDYTSTEYKMNFSSKFQYFKLAGGLGYHERQFDQAGLKDLDTISWHFSIKGQNPPDLEAGERPRSYMSLSFAQNFNNTGNGNEYYRADRITLLLGHLFLEKLDTKIETYFQKSAYEDDLQNRDDDTYALSGSVAYFVNEWVTLTLKSGIESRDSSVAANDYDNAFVLFKFTFNYDLGSK
ncbi:MAG: outer membrane beta-barrel protein [Proteobacteria bacterium]|nr:outer membrane beta-barrel protein [Pseudomonadota bacterium]MBU1584862.1 outer membrane beta-barrel protein [Pseudomonadota bacterium]MBU2456103.1 outer membrane beta-barrel protein [Pseudomonadota bacterium]MBU2628764.1 outer membrane beta-barrel protein [Pseudomonadota bacterium]